MRTTLLTILAIGAVISPLALAADRESKTADRLDESANVISDMMHASDKGIPQDLMNKAECVIVVPNMKRAGFIFGAKYGRGFSMCRRPGGAGWSAPAAMRIEGGSFGLQLGGQATDFILLVMNPRGADSILTSQVKLGGDMAAAAGPKGRSAAASTDVTMRAEILSYSRSRGLFAGISLEGSTLRPDNDGNERLYGKGTSAKDIVLNSAIRPPASAKLLLATLNKTSPRNESGE